MAGTNPVTNATSYSAQSAAAGRRAGTQAVLKHPIDGAFARFVQRTDFCANDGTYNRTTQLMHGFPYAEGCRQGMKDAYAARDAQRLYNSQSSRDYRNAQNSNADRK